jgi:hypothetical protein
VSNVWLRELGLETADVPSSSLYWDGPSDNLASTTLTGERHGRAVRIAVGPRASSARLTGRVPAFAVRERELALAPEPGAPPSVAQALRELSPHPRWASVRVTGGADGVLVERRHGASEATQALWLDDLARRASRPRRGEHRACRFARRDPALVLAQRSAGRGASGCRRTT